MSNLTFVRLALAAAILEGAVFPSAAQTIRREYWIGIPGSSIADLLNNPAYPNNPSAVDFRTSFEAPVDWAEEYGTRMRGYVIAPTTGSYFFWIASDDQSQLFLSTDESPATKRLIATVNTWTASRQWTKESNQRSAAVALQAGQRYYIEAIQKEGNGGDNLAVGWQLPSGALERPIPGTRLAPFQNSTNPPSITTEPADLNVEEGQPATFRVTASGKEPLYFQWQRNGSDVVGEISSTLVLFKTSLADNGARFRCSISNDLGGTLSREATLLVHAETVPPAVASVHPPAGAIVRVFSQVEVLFTEPITGLDAADLRANGQPAAALTGVGPGPYIFQFPPITNGPAQMTWSSGHGITDLAAPANAFPGTDALTLSVVPDASMPDVRINEIVAANILGLVDEDGDHEDWIELVNRSPFAVNLAGWSLTDDPDEPGEWTFPAVTLEAGQYLVVFASEKDRRPTTPGAKLHTNFKLSVAGEYLGLFNLESPRQAVDELLPRFPGQRNDYSFGRDSSNRWRYFRIPTPATANGASAISEIVPPPHFSVHRGYFSQPFNLILSSPFTGAEIRYTINGTDPTETNGFAYADPIPINRTTVLRAAAFKANYLPSTTVTHTYLYNLTAARRSLPAISIVTATNNLLGPTGIIGIRGGTYANGPWQAVNPGDYHNPSQHGVAWERPASAEWIIPQDNSGFQVDAGLRVQGSDWMRPRYTAGSKFSYRLYFRGDYGAGELEYPIFGNVGAQTFDKLVLRAGHNDDTNPFIKDELMRRLMMDTGQVGSHGTFAALFINGVYKGYYNPVERIDQSFCQLWFGGTNNWDVIAQFGDARDGDAVQWNATRNFVTAGNMTVPGNYLEAGRRLDLTNFVDYLLVNIYGANGDWPHNNWTVARERVPNAPFRYIMWDSEFALGTYGRPVTWNTVANELNPSVNGSEVTYLFRALLASPEFRLLFADRVHKHMFNGGALANTNVSARFQQLRAMLLPLIPSYDNFILTTWIPQRRTPMLNQLTSVGLVASSNAPSFSQHGGRVPLGFNLSLSASNGVIYFTTNGSDPRVSFSGNVSASASTYAAPLILNRSLTVKARSLSGANWSALTEATFQVAELGVPLRITEIMYNPPGGDAYEFVELQNLGSTPLDLSGFSLEDEVNFVFPGGVSIPPGGILILSSDDNPAAFAARYPGVTVAGRFAGNLGNGGGRLVLKDRSGRIIQSVDYNDSDGWPRGPDGGGSSLELIRVNEDPDDPLNWRASSPSGSPGRVDSDVPALPGLRLNEIMADNRSAVPNGGLFPDWIELHNATGAPINCAGWSLTDDEGQPRRFVFPAGTSVPANGYLVVWCDGLTNAPGLHAPFSLERNGETVFLLDASTNRIDALAYGIQVADLTVGRDPSGEWVLTTPTPGALNQIEPLDAQSSLILNEWMANPHPGDDDWIEIYNRSAVVPVSLYGLHVGTSNALFQIRSRSFVAPGGYVLLRADERPGADHLDFRLPSTPNVLRLYSASAELIDQVNYSTQLEGVSQGRYPDGTAAITPFPTSPSPEASNYLLTWTGPVLNEIMARNRDAVRDVDGNAVDWIELFNPNSAPFDLSGVSVSVDGMGDDAWAIPDGVQVPANGHLLVWCDGSRAASTQNVANLNLGHSLPAEGGVVYLHNSLGQIVDSVAYGFQIANLSIGRSGGAWSLLNAPTPGTANAAPAVLSPASSLRLNEWMADPLSSDDWFEIFNSDAQPVSLTGLSLTDDPSLAGVAKFVVGPLSFIGGRSWVKWIADDDASKGPDHVNFRLAGLGETLRLYNGELILDTVDIYPQAPGVSYGRLPDGGGTIVSFATSPTPSASNYLPLPDVFINELLSHTDPPLEDAVELLNKSAAPVDIGGWFMSNSDADFKKFRVPDGTVIPAGGYWVIYENQFNGGSGSSAPFTFNSAHGDTAYLSASDGAGTLTGHRAQVGFGASANGVAFGRLVTSLGENHFVALRKRTFGVANPATVQQFRSGAGARNAYPRVGPVVINEIMYHPVAWIGTNTVENPDEEFIELRNISVDPVRLFDPAHPANTWRVGGGIDYVFPTGVTLVPGGFLLLVNFDPATNAAARIAFRGRYGLSDLVLLYGPYAGRLDNAGESIQLIRPDAPQTAPNPEAGFVPQILVEEIKYGDALPWPVEADGGGKSLQRMRFADYGNDPVNWLAANPTPASENLGSMPDADADRMDDNWESASGLNPRVATDADLDPDGDGLNNLEEFLCGTIPGDPGSCLRIDSVSQSPGSTRIHFQAIAGRTYSIEFSGAAAGGWQKLKAIEAQSASGTIAVNDSGAGDSTRYYRLVTPNTP